MRTILAVVASISFMNAARAQQPQNYTLTVTPAQLETVGKALGALPFREVSALIAELDKQVTDQAKVHADYQRSPLPGNAENPTKPTETSK